MTAIYKRELSSYFNSMIGYAFVAVLIFFTGIYFMAYNLYNGLPQFSYTLYSLMSILLITIPTLTSLPNWEGLLESRGLKLVDGYIADPGSYYPQLGSAFAICGVLSTYSPVTDGCDSDSLTLFTNSRGFEALDPGTDEDWTITTFLSTTGQGLAVTEDDQQTQGTYILGAVADGSDGGRLTVFGSSSLLNGQIISQNPSLVNQTLFMDAPTMEINLTDEDGTQVKLLIGSTADSGDYYAKVDGSDTVYTIASTLPTALDIQVDELIALAEFPSISEDNIQSVTWTSGESTVTLVKEETESEPAEDSSSDPSADTSSDSSTDSNQEDTTTVWKVDGQTVSEDNTTFISLMAQLSELAFSDCYDYHKQAQTRTDCGLDTPVGVLTVVYTDGDEEKTMTLTLGALAEGGESYYAMLDDDPIIYLIPSNEIGSLFSMTVDNLTAVEETDAESGTETETDTQSDTTTD